jgi:hypothetical protein
MAKATRRRKSDQPTKPSAQEERVPAEFLSTPVAAQTRNLLGWCDGCDDDDDLERFIKLLILIALMASSLKGHGGKTLPQRKIGKHVPNPRYKRKYRGHLVRTGEESANCSEASIIEWQGFKVLDPAGCANLTFDVVQTFIDDETNAAEDAAKALCTDPDCSVGHTDVTYQEWDCKHDLNAETDEEKSILYLTLQISLTCDRA